MASMPDSKEDAQPGGSWSAEVKGAVVSLILAADAAAATALVAFLSLEAIFEVALGIWNIQERGKYDVHKRTA